MKPQGGLSKKDCAFDIIVRPKASLACSDVTPYSALPYLVDFLAARALDRM
jgi:hypothetical protein